MEDCQKTASIEQALPIAIGRTVKLPWLPRHDEMNCGNVSLEQHQTDRQTDRQTDGVTERKTT
jgi:hypothetical protein